MAETEAKETVELHQVDPPAARVSNTQDADEDTQNNTHKDEEEDDVLEQSIFVQHMTTYPAVAAMTGFAASFPVVKIFASNAVPLFMSWKKRNDPVARRAVPALKRADKFGDEVLDRVDKRFPQLKSVQPDAIYSMAATPVRNARTAASVYGNATADGLKNRFIYPSKKAVQAFRKQYQQVIDTNNKALIRSQFDPMLSPLNDRVEGIIIDYIPGEGELKKPVVSSELGRTWRLGRSAFYRARPALRDQASYLSDLPAASGSRLREIYQQQRENHGTGRRGSALAALETSRHVANEGAQFVQQLRKRYEENRVNRSKRAMEQAFTQNYHHAQGQGGSPEVERDQPPVLMTDEPGFHEEDYGRV